LKIIIPNADLSGNDQNLPYRLPSMTDCSHAAGEEKKEKYFIDKGKYACLFQSVTFCHQLKSVVAGEKLSSDGFEEIFAGTGQEIMKEMYLTETFASIYYSNCDCIFYRRMMP
jgi:hypothetical protein